MMQTIVRKRGSRRACSLSVGFGIKNTYVRGPALQRGHSEQSLQTRSLFIYYY